eukprot:CAMPEP_0184409464 /NCGR_PEP_ID=MMETSP0738-20130409/4118_1 /TAXON_ID=385413 /ORGANISM="Thalassiosira miniscula, Strain CCMP1093" /LENGTH=59 /DNA_ID=CAMNT_0026767195 /DNA_START=342 /DNA_END=518 /DNA_ORIENTATION=-
MTHIIGNVLVDEDDSNVISLGKGFEGGFDHVSFGVLFDGEEVARVGGSVAYSCEEEAGD